MFTSLPQKWKCFCSCVYLSHRSVRILRLWLPTEFVLFRTEEIYIKRILYSFLNALIHISVVTTWCWFFTQNILSEANLTLDRLKTITKIITFMVFRLAYNWFVFLRIYQYKSYYEDCYQLTIFLWCHFKEIGSTYLISVYCSMYYTV